MSERRTRMLGFPWQRRDLQRLPASLRCRSRRRRRGFARADWTLDLYSGHRGPGRARLLWTYRRGGWRDLRPPPKALRGPSVARHIYESGITADSPSFRWIALLISRHSSPTWALSSCRSSWRDHFRRFDLVTISVLREMACRVVDRHHRGGTIRQRICRRDRRHAAQRGDGCVARHGHESHRGAGAAAHSGAGHCAVYRRYSRTHCGCHGDWLRRRPVVTGQFAYPCPAP